MAQVFNKEAIHPCSCPSASYHHYKARWFLKRWSSSLPLSGESFPYPRWYILRQSTDCVPPKAELPAVQHGLLGLWSTRIEKIFIKNKVNCYCFYSFISQYLYLYLLSHVFIPTLYLGPNHKDYRISGQKILMSQLPLISCTTHCHYLFGLCFFLSSPSLQLTLFL